MWKLFIEICLVKILEIYYYWYCKGKSIGIQRGKLSFCCCCYMIVQIILIKDIIFSFFSLFEVSGVIEEKNVRFFFIDFKIIIFFLVNDGFKF